MDWHAIVSLLSHISIDVVILAAFAVLVTVDALRSGPSRATAFALSLPLSLVILNYVPDAKYMSDLEKQLNSALLIAVLSVAFFIVIFILVYRMTDTFGADSFRPVQAILTGVAVTAVAAVVWLQIPALENVWHFGPQIQAIFGAAFRFWWFLAAYITLAFARG